MFSIFNANNLNKIPIPKGREDLLSKIAALSRELTRTDSTSKDEKTQNELEQTERKARDIKDKIDQLVFDLYSLSNNDKTTIIAEMRSIVE